MELERRELALLFRVRARLCALPLGAVVETMRPLPVGDVAGAASFVRGVAVIRGAAVPVVDVARVLGEDTIPLDASGRFITLKVADRFIALAVDAVVGVRQLPLDSYGGLPPLLRDGEDAIHSIGTLDSELLLVLRSARLVPKEPRGTDAGAGA